MSISSEYYVILLALKYYLINIAETRFVTEESLSEDVSVPTTVEPSGTEFDGLLGIDIKMITYICIALGSCILLSMVLITICMACLSANASLDKEEIALKSVRKTDTTTYFGYDVVQGDIPELDSAKPKPKPRDPDAPGSFRILKRKQVEESQVSSSEYGLKGWSKSLVQEVTDQNLLYLSVYNLDMRSGNHAVATQWDEEITRTDISAIATFVLSAQKDKAIQFGSTIFHMKFVHTECYAATGIAQTNKGRLANRSKIQIKTITYIFV